MSSKLIMFVVFVFLVGNAICMIIEGSNLGADDIDLINSLTGYSVLEISGSGLIGIPKMGIGFFATGLPKVLFWNYPFLDGGLAVYFKWFVLYPVSIGIIAAFGMLVLNVAQGLLSALRP